MASLDELWGKLKAATDSKSLLKKNLTEEIYNELKDKKTGCGGTLAECIRSGCENTDSGTGIYASDPEAYDTFGAVLMPVLRDYHKVAEVSHPACNFGDIDNIGFGNLDPDNQFIVSTRVRVGRSHKSFGFPPTCNKEDRIKMEEMCKAALDSLEGEHKGTYFPLVGMSDDVKQQLTADHFLFNDKDRFLKAAGGYDDWPHGRGIFHNPDKTFLIWVNEEDHLRIISMQMGGDLGAVYTRLVKGIQKMSEKLEFAHHDKLGFLTFCPTNLGTTLRASVHIKIPKLAATPEFKEFCDKYNIQARGSIHGEHTESVGGVYDISNKRRLGLSEYDALMEMKAGVEAVIAEEKRLS
ncbi:Arginine kinase [Mizuhopecten yessoensis]|uniref:Arginine kinase n=1 Tax=Mizuhopecten yessoensis TaxID=6573 RepID=A0A210QAS9_MIZYE|nr:Arginine kinase [Mizuhopecten yessoensis]